MGLFTCVTGVSGGQEHPHQRHPARPRRPPPHSAASRPRPAPPSTASTTSTRSSTSTRAPSAAPALQPGHLHRPAHPHPRPLLAGVPEAKARGYGPGALQLQRQGRALRGLPGRRPHQGRDALPARHVRALRHLPRQALQPRNLEIRYKGKTIFEVLEMTVEQALAFFSRCPSSPASSTP